jgi:RNA polymerase sigma-70 factor (ECF subfamily)
VKQQTRNDEQLMLLVQEADDHGAFERLISRHQKKLFGYLWRFTGDRQATEDLFQETCMRIYQARASFNHEYSFSSWVYRIATNACLDMRKKKSHAMEKATDDEIINRHAVTHDRPDAALFEETKSRKIQGLLGELPEKLRIVLLLKHYEDLSIKAIAAILDIPEGTVKSRLFKGIKQLTVLAEKRGLSDEM